MASKTSQINLSKQGKLLLAKLGRDFLEVESKGHIWQENIVKKKGKTMSANCTLFNSRKPNSIKRNTSQLQGRWRQLKLQSKKDHDLPT